MHYLPMLLIAGTTLAAFAAGQHAPTSASKPFSKTIDQLLEGTGLVDKHDHDGNVLVRGVAIDVVFQGDPHAPTRILIGFEAPTDGDPKAFQQMTQIVANAVADWNGVKEIYDANRSMVKAGKVDSIIAKVKGCAVSLSYVPLPQRFLISIIRL
jgi:hypothetical protein